MGVPKFGDETSMIGVDRYDVSKKASIPPVTDGFTLLKFNLAPRQKVTLKITGFLKDGSAWFVPYGGNVHEGQYLTSALQKTQIKFDVDPDGSVSDYISVEEGVSCGATLTCTQKGVSGSTNDSRRCVPSDPRTRYNVTPSYDATKNGYALILNPKDAESNSYSICDDTRAASACGIHGSRVYYDSMFRTGQSFLNWIYDTNSVAMSWRFDDWECIDEDCGYREDGIGAPYQLENSGLGMENDVRPGAGGCVVPLEIKVPGEPVRWDAKIYSIGFAYRPQIRPDDDWIRKARTAENPVDVPGSDKITQGGIWWKMAGGSNAPVDEVGGGGRVKMIDGKPIIHYFDHKGLGVDLDMTFENLSWLTGATDMSDIPELSDFMTDNPYNYTFKDSLGTLDIPADQEALLLPNSTTKPRKSQYTMMALMCGVAFVVIVIVIFSLWRGVALNGGGFAPHALSATSALKYRLRGPTPGAMF